MKLSTIARIIRAKVVLSAEDLELKASKTKN